MFEFYAMVRDDFRVGFLALRAHDEVVHVGFYFFIDARGVKFCFEY